MKYQIRRPGDFRRVSPRDQFLAQAHLFITLASVTSACVFAFLWENQRGANQRVPPDVVVAHVPVAKVAMASTSTVTATDTPLLPALTRPVDTIVVHHTASSHGDRDAINQWHLERGWNGIGYHFVITNGVTNFPGNACRDGEIQIGRDLNVVGAHKKGHNVGSIGIVLIGHHEFSEAQHASLRALVRALCERYDISTIEPHHENCPGPNIGLDELGNELMARRV